MILKDKDFSLSQLQIFAVNYQNGRMDQISLKIICYNWLRQSIMEGNVRKRKAKKDKGIGGSPRKGYENHT